MNIFIKFSKTTLMNERIDQEVLIARNADKENIEHTEGFRSNAIRDINGGMVEQETET